MTDLLSLEELVTPKDFIISCSKPSAIFLNSLKFRSRLYSNNVSLSKMSWSELSLSKSISSSIISIASLLIFCLLNEYGSNIGFKISVSKFSVK